MSLFYSKKKKSSEWLLKGHYKSCVVHVVFPFQFLFSQLFDRLGLQLSSKFNLTSCLHKETLIFYESEILHLSLQRKKNVHKMKIVHIAHKFIKSCHVITRFVFVSSFPHCFCPPHPNYFHLTKYTFSASIAIKRANERFKLKIELFSASICTL